MGIACILFGIACMLMGVGYNVWEIILLVGRFMPLLGIVLAFVGYFSDEGNKK